MQPDTHYAKCGELHIAYQIFGEGSVNLAIVPPVVMTFGKASTPLENIGVAAERFPQRLTAISQKSLIFRQPEPPPEDQRAEEK